MGKRHLPLEIVNYLRLTMLSYALTLFFSLIITSLPFLLLGILISSGLLVLVDNHYLLTKLPRSRLLGAILGSSLGLIIPVGSYGNIPVTRRLLLQGISPAIAISFLIAAPTLNPIVIWLTWILFPQHPQILFFRLLIGWSMGIIVGLLLSISPPSFTAPSFLANRSFFLTTGSDLLTSPESQPLHRSGNLIYEYKSETPTHHPWRQRWRWIVDNSWQELRELGSILLVGCAIAATLQVLIVPAQLLTWGQTPLTQLLVMPVLSLILSLGTVAGSCWLSPLNETLFSGSILAFLLFTAFADLKAIGLLFLTFRPKAILYLLLILSQLILLITLIFNFYSR